MIRCIQDLANLRHEVACQGNPMDASQLASLSHAISDPREDCVILGEGNTSALVSEDEFLVKASGFQLSTIEPSGFVRVRLPLLLEALKEESLTDAQVKAQLHAAVCDGSDLVPSTESFMHALLLSIPGTKIVVHTHPSPLLSLLCLKEAKDIALQRLYPDEIVCCGPSACHVPYADPGLPLAKAIREAVIEYNEREEMPPKTIWLQNHGLICLGRSTAEVIAATRMSVKAARVWLGALQCGRELTTLTQHQINRIHSRPDEHHRQRLLWA